MPRRPRANQRGVSFHHIMVQGINKSYIFESKIYMEKYQEIMLKYSEEMEIKIIAYCIMNNHVHLLVNSDNIQKMSKMMQKINTKYAKFYNFIKARVGYVFRDRYLSQPILNESQLINCVKYIHDNPVKARMVNEPKEYKYSNYVDFYRKSNLIQLKELTGIDFSNLQNVEMYVEGDFVDLEINMKERVLGCTKRFCKNNQIQTYEIFVSLNILAKLIKHMKEEQRIKYIEIVKVLQIPKNIFEKIKRY